MAVTMKVLVQPVQLTTGDVVYYTTPANTKARISKGTGTNTTGTARTVTIYLVASGGSVGDSNTITKTQSIPANSTWEFYEIEGHNLETGDSIHALADGGSAVTFRVSGLEVV